MQLAPPALFTATVIHAKNFVDTKIPATASASPSKFVAIVWHFPDAAAVAVAAVLLQ